MQFDLELTGLAPILIVLLIALAVGGYLLYQKQTKPVTPQPVSQSSPNPLTSPVASDSTETANPDSIGADWKTYNYSNFGYSFKILASYIITSNKPAPNEKNVIQLIDLNETNASQGPNDFIISVQLGNLNFSLQNLVQNDGFTKTGTKNINNKEWIIATSPRETQYLTQVGNKIYTIDGRNISLLEKILSTFKFTQ